MATKTATLPADWENYWTDFTLLKGRSLSDRTKANYRDSLVYLGRFLEPKVPLLANLNRRQIGAFLDYTLQTTSATTTGLRFRGLSAFLGWLAKPGEDDEPFLEHNPLKGLRPPKVDEQPFKVLSLDDVRQVLAACKGPLFEDRRDTALILLMFDTGCRRGEVASMRIAPEWLNLTQGIAMVTGKTGPRIVALGPTTCAALYRYTRLRQKRAHGTDALWIGRKGKLAGNGIYQVLLRRFRQAGVDTTHKAHVFRHSFAHHFSASGGSEGDLMALAGWKSSAMAHRYGKSAAAERARVAHGRFSPAERL
jgi:integrase/recombinase XerC